MYDNSILIKKMRFNLCHQRSKIASGKTKSEQEIVSNL
jgi:hypothetical protein